MKNIILNTDSYKVSMYKQYPPGTEYVYSYIESRGGMFDSTVFFGLQAFQKEYLIVPITMKDVDEGEEYWTAHGLPFNKEGWEYIVNEHEGLLPVEIKAVQEGQRVDVGVPLLTIVNTDPKCFWLTTWLETALLRAIWYPTTVATLSNNIRKLILAGLERTGTPEDIDFKLHDFGARGVSSMESAGLGGMAHLVSFNGTDTMTANVFARKYYYEQMAGFSIPASEHSTITAWGKEHEEDAYRNMLNQFKGTYPVIACVSDSYDIFNAAEKLWGGALREEVINSGSTLVVRPDSGEPRVIVMDVLNILGKQFGYTVNEKGYKVLKNVRVIQGDGVNYNSIQEILNVMMKEGWSVDNIAFGMGGGLLQQVDRDTQKFAMKCSAIYNNGQWIDVSKDPVTDRGKRSKAGRVVAMIQGDKIVTGYGEATAMFTVFKDGWTTHDTDFQLVRAIARQ